MASYRAIAAVSAALKGVLDDARPTDFSTADIQVLQLTDFHKATPIVDGISILLYRVALSGMPRTLSGRPTPDGRRRLPALPVDLYYLITPWSRTTTMEHLLLGWVMRTLEDASILSSGVLNHYLSPEVVFEDDETVCLVNEPLALQDLANLWDSLKPNPHISVAYVARTIHLETILQPLGGDLVRERDFDYANGPA